MVLLRNAIPVFGVYGLDWTGGLAVFEIWFDGVTALALMMALQMRGFLRRLSQKWANIACSVIEV